jgi:integrase
MTKTMYQNEQIKREFLKHLKGAEGFAESSINTFAEAVDQWQTFTNNEDFANFNDSKALAFCDWLKSRKSNTEAGTISLVTQYNYLRRVKRFFKWLSGEPNYKSKILKNDIEFLRLSKGDACIARQGTTKQMPTFDEARAIIESIEIKNEIDMRDRAVICFALITGIRISAITTLRMKNFDMENKLINQNPADGVKTKNSKKIVTTFFPIGWDEPEKYFIEWYKYLKSKSFQPNDPIFPATMNGFTNEESEYSKVLVGKGFWNGSGGARKIFEKRCKNADLPYFNPHSFRHLVVNILSKTRLTEEEKRAISLNLGHANVGTTFGSYGYGSMNEDDAVKIVQKLKTSQIDGNSQILSDEEKTVLEGLIKRSL